MKNVIRLLAMLACAGTAFATVDPQRPMVTGKGNVEVRPAKVIVTNQTAEASEGPVVILEKFEVTGSLIPLAPAPAKAMPRVHLKQR